MADKLITPSKLAQSLEYVSDSTATTVAELRAEYNALIAQMRGVLMPASPWWVLSDTGLRATYGGGATFTSDNSQTGGSSASGNTYISGLVTERMRQNGTIRTVVAEVRTYTAAVDSYQIKFKVFRPDGAGGYDFVGESEAITLDDTAGVATTTTFNLDTPIACEIEDVFGVWISGSATDGLGVRGEIMSATVSGASILYTSGDESGTGVAFSSTLSNRSLNIRPQGVQPYVIGTGDSIMEGHNGGVMGSADRWHSWYDNGPAGNPENEILYQLRALIGSEFQYQNHALGGQTFAWVASTGIVSSVAANPEAILIHCGFNDVNTGRTWSAVEADLDTIRAAVPASIDLWIDEILPSTSLSDADAATVRTWNANLATWCTANSAHLIECHDAMGQTRSSTGEMDDLRSAYNFDGTHLTTAGVEALAAIIKAALVEQYG